MPASTRQRPGASADYGKRLTLVKSGAFVWRLPADPSCSGGVWGGTEKGNAPIFFFSGPARPGPGGSADRAGAGVGFLASPFFMSVLEGFWKGFGAILEGFRSSKSMKKSITERIDFSSGFFINFWWVFERFLDTFSDGKTVRKSLSREGRFHPFFHSFFEVSHSKSKPCDPRSIRKFSYNSWGPASR